MNEQDKKDFLKEIQPLSDEIRIHFLEERVTELEATQHEIFNVLKQLTRVLVETTGNAELVERVRNV
jgi:hypothetical protein